MSSYGVNVGFVDELYERYRTDPSSVSEAWQEFFADYRPAAGAETPAAAPGVPGSRPLVGIAAKIAENMELSLGVPTATSAREIPVKLLEENRRLVNQHQATTAGPKISFTHLIAWAVVRALAKHPGMNAGFLSPEGKPHRLDRPEINLGLAIDVERRGERLLLVPNIKNVATLGFTALVAAYDDLVHRARSNELELEDFEDTTVTLTNPGMIGTALSVPRLMSGQGTIVGIGSIGYPAEYSGMAPEVISELGLSKTMTVTSTYDHRVIQGAESGAFLSTLEQLLLGRDGFYETIFLDLSVPYEPVAWAGDQNPQVLGETGSPQAIEKQASVLQLIRAYRVRGHHLADLDPLGYEPQPHPELELSHYGLSVWDMDRAFISGRLGGRQRLQSLREILDTLRETYCRHVGVEFMFIADPEIRGWLQERMEETRNAAPLSLDEQKHVLRCLNAAEAFEKFLGTHYVGQKRFSLEGAETLIPALDLMLADAAEVGVEEALIGMAHRGRLNVLVNIVGKSYTEIFKEFEGHPHANTPHGSGDVKYHLGAAGTYRSPAGKEVRVRVASNPSHLEAVNPVVEGMVRARQDRLADERRERVLPVLIHGDAAFPGQGVVAETLNLSQLSGYRTGGTVHVVINNRIGFTTGPKDARSSMYPTDLAKTVSAPIFHVNGDHPEDATRVMRLALAFRQRFKRDVVVDLVCYRRWGHNEADDPSYTHPTLYSRIESHRSVRKLYTEQLLRRGDIDVETAEKALEDFRARLQAVRDEVLELEDTTPTVSAIDDSEDSDTALPIELDTGVETDRLESVLDGLARVPDGFHLHPKLGKQLDSRAERFAGGRIDWALAEALCFGSLALDGTAVRLSGEDSARGTFSQRHSVLYDYSSAEPYAPLANLDPGQGPFHAHDSLLSEFAVLGFEYGYSVEHADALVLWEAQFGDFCNGAQVIIDQFIASAEDKWGQRSGLVLLLPHGYEGQGPEHSSARLERFLQLAARRNLRVCYPTTPAQYFHLLRRQVAREDRKPLVVMTPKSLLRHPGCVSDAKALASGRFATVLDDEAIREPERVRRIVLCSGKLYYDLAAQRGDRPDEVALIRLEQLYPFPFDRLTSVLSRYPASADRVWAQEEPRNMGAWSFVQERMLHEPGQSRRLRYVGRTSSPSPATGSYARHRAVQEALVARAIGGDAGEDSDVGLDARSG